MTTTDTLITKRIIVSGLTPAITADDISRRLSSFGTVKATDGFGLLDGVGQPRKFAFVTLETTTGNLAKCMNLLSGTTWKGAKIRLGEAKPDYAEKIALENKKTAEEPPKKRQRHYGGAYSDDMSLVTPENVAEREGWNVSSLGRMTHPVKTRPTHPLVDLEETKSKKGKMPGEPEKQKKKKRAKDPDTRARRTTIDMPAYGSTHLKGVFLDLEVPDTARRRTSTKGQPIDYPPESSSESESDVPVQAPSPLAPRKLLPDVPPAPVNDSPIPSSSKTTVPPPTPIPTSSATLPEGSVDIQKEKAQALGLLASLFGNDDDDWVGRESVGSDIDENELVKGDVMLVDDDEAPEFEIVPNPGGNPTTTKRKVDESEEDSEDEEDVAMAPEMMTSEAPQTAPSPPKATAAKLKDLFAPREQEAGFSLLGHLDLDMELDEEMSFVTEQPIQAPLLEATSSPAPTTLTLQTHSSQAPLVLNPRQALFFPLPAQEGSTTKARQRDVFDLAKDGGWYWRDPAVGFFRTESEDEIRARWEGCKGELTREWKRRWREAGKVSRRKKGGGGDGDE
ncbi:hypothetical protein NLJ89_g782 [Agrocybe chaxingu]|uniref:RRM domain-containing protein n=1 Tax=Agrocybe chaxingu TaxID=84603 RepID=A0A9W8N1A7_9AGAR|nr:hypothetical protein NLJ89_g782 [Agrocybe chaxingu]